MFGDDFADDIAEVGGVFEVAVLVELIGGEASPFAEHFVSLGDGSADGEHAVRPPVIGAAGAVFANSASEVAECKQEGVLHLAAHVFVKRGDGIAEIFEAVGESTGWSALGVMGVPSAVVDLDDFGADVRFDQSCGFEQLFGDACAGIFCAVGGLVFLLGDGFELAGAFECGFSGFGEQVLGGGLVLLGFGAVGVLKGCMDLSLISSEFGHGEVADSADRIGGGTTAKNSWQVAADGHRADGSVSLRGDKVAVEPAVGRNGVADHTGFPGVLFFEVRAGVFGISDGLQGDGGMVFEHRGKRIGRRVKAEEAIDVACCLAAAARAFDRDAATMFVVVVIAIGNDEIQTIDPTAKEDGHEGFVFRNGRCTCGGGEDGLKGGESTVGGYATGGFEEVST